MVTLINSTGSRTVDGKKISYPRRKMVVGDYELSEGETVAIGPKPDEKGVVHAGYPTFKEIADFVKGAVEFQLDEKGNEKADSVLSFFRDGWNSAESLSAWNRTPAAATAKINNAVEKLAANLPGKSVEEIRKLLGL